MLLRAFLLLVAVVAVSIGLTMYFGQEVLVALGLLLTQAKVLSKKLMQVELPAVLAWLKNQAGMFFRIELVKKWLMTTAVPLLLGKAVLKKFESFIQSYREAIGVRYDAMMDWYRDLDTPVKIVALLIVLFTTVAVSVTSVGLWLILFSVKLPFWFVAFLASTWNMIWVSTQKWAFKVVAYFQLGWAWRVVKGRLPPDYLERKRRFDFRVARIVVRQRRMTLRQLEDKKDSLSMRVAILRERWRQSGKSDTEDG